MANQRIAGLIQIQVNGEIFDAKGDFTYNLGFPKRTGIQGADGTHGYKEELQQAYIEGKITDRQTLDVSALVSMTDVTVTLTLANGKTVVFHNAWYAAEGNVNTAEAEIDLRFESRKQGQEI